ncbi:hypothetical protein Ga0123462_1012 [Mariprofundus ferrinatatus]|uniref:Uncharacterized protein n=1 Tax=Mariprofundus ferrinatatus TaxID=1921087 RepID=A0A2K8L7P0_9PROT|nr:hypothetical protein [Mariprofundus ferrinatatus]ATX81881.1 hypothetical protein Ga0123462_1012 [Mariprofundus ferrinatatus]
MNIDFSLAPWGMTFAAAMFVIGNGVWMNRLARNSAWMGWIMWTLSAIVVLVAAAAIEQQLGNGEGIWASLTSVNAENHWIVVTLYALISIPGAASILFRQPVGWTRLAALATVIIVLIPLGSQLQDPNDPRLALSLGITSAACALIWLWSKLLDCEPEHVRKTVPVEEMDQ